MATSMMRRAMTWLGLAEEDYDDYGYYGDEESTEAPPPPGARLRAAGQPAERGGNEPPRQPSQGGISGTIRPLPQRDGRATSEMARGSTLRPLPVERAMVHVVAPARYADAKEIADRFMANQPVIINLQVADRELQRRMIDFCSGVAYSLRGSMEKVADQVFLLTPSNVEVTAEERERLQQRGLFNS